MLLGVKLAAFAAGLGALASIVSALPASCTDSAPPANSTVSAPGPAIQPFWLLSYREEFQNYGCIVSNGEDGYVFASRDALNQLIAALRAGRQSTVDLINTQTIFSRKIIGGDGPIDGATAYDELFATAHSGLLEGTQFWYSYSLTIETDADRFAELLEAALDIAAAGDTPTLGDPQSGSFGITFINSQAFAFNLTGAEYPGSYGGFVRINTKPSPVLKAISGVEQLVWTQEHTDYALEPANGAMIWTSSANPIQSVGLRIITPYQEFRIGTSPYYEILYTSETKNQSWTKAPGGASATYDFPSFLNFSCRVTSQASGTALVLSASIE